MEVRRSRCAYRIDLIGECRLKCVELEVSIQAVWSRCVDPGMFENNLESIAFLHGADDNGDMDERKRKDERGRSIVWRQI